MTQPEIRFATGSDLDAIAQLLRGLAESLGDPQPYHVDLNAIERYGFGKFSLFHALIAEQGDTPIGLCLYFPEFSTWRCKSGLYVQDLFVDKNFRGNGLGKALLTEALRHASVAWEAAYLRLAVHVLNRDALEFYRRLGFEADPDNRVMMLTDTRFTELIAN
jgi:ribosomal protein S18 acetylase RimI-like enzyme